MANDFRSARFWAKEIIEQAMFEGARAIDATMGNGYDTLWLCELAGERGKVYAFDVQPEAVDRTNERIVSAGYDSLACLFLLGHERMKEVVQEPVDAIVFNLGWLPGAEHGVTTQTSTTLQAVEAALSLLKEDAVMTVCIYPGHEEGERELHALLKWAGNLDPKYFDVIHKCYLNQPNHPPQLLAVRKMKIKK